MARRIQFAEGEFYHVYNRGVDKREVYMEERDYARFLVLLFVCNSTGTTDIEKSLRDDNMSIANLYDERRSNTFVDIGAFCLMPNHFHLLLREKQETGISRFMQKLSTAYTMYFNQKYERTGSLFGGRFKAKHVTNDPYLRYLFAYIHLNPVALTQSDWKEVGIKDLKSVKNYLNNYVYSSYPDFRGAKRREGKILTLQNFPKYFQSTKDFGSFLDDFLIGEKQFSEEGSTFPVWEG